MIGITHKDHKIIAAIPILGGEEGHMIVVGKSLPQAGKRHQPTFVTWFTDGQGVFDSPTYFTDHDVTADRLRRRAIGDMINRADYVLAAVEAQVFGHNADALAALEKR